MIGHPLFWRRQILGRPMRVVNKMVQEVKCATYESALFAKLFAYRPALCLPNFDFRIQVF
jgi:hypothetical protein